MNHLDSLISWFSPQSGLRRARARAAADLLMRYDAVRSDRRLGNRRATGASGNTEIGPAAATLRNGARELVRNNGYARRAVREWAKRVVGTGITPRPDTGSDAVNAIIRERWKVWAQQCMSDARMPFAAAQKMIVASQFVSGEVLIRIWDRRPSDRLEVPFQLQILESDYLDTARTYPTQTGYILQGVEFDQLGRVLGYWLFGQHPGDVLRTSNRGLMSKFIPVESVLHHVELERPGDVRAVSRFSAVANKLRDVDEYADAEIVRKKTEACLSILVTQPEGVDGPTVGAPLATDSDGNKIESLQPGMIMYGAQGTGAQFFAPASSGDFAAHKKTELREIAVGLDIPYILLDDNMEAVNYSSFRGGLLAYRDAIEEYRWNWLIPQVLDPIWIKFIDTLVMMGEIPEANYAHEWDPPPFDLLDRAAEAEADRTELQIGKVTWPQLVGRQGNDPDKQLSEIAKWRAGLAAAGVTFARNYTERAGDPNNPDGGSNANSNPAN